jgi:hypothetical protein
LQVQITVTVTVVTPDRDDTLDDPSPSYRDQLVKTADNIVRGELTYAAGRGQLCVALPEIGKIELEVEDVQGKSVPG